MELYRKQRENRAIFFYFEIQKNASLGIKKSGPFTESALYNI